MVERILVDTNVLVYAHDRSAPRKQMRAIEVLDRIVDQSLGVLTPQVLAEFFAVVTRKIPAPLSVADAYESLENLLLSWECLEYSADIVLEAARGVRDHRLSFWDALIWASARLHRVPLVLSEDFNSGAAVEGIRFVNPFLPGFDIESLLRT